jgi:hypothetical protein
MRSKSKTILTALIGILCFTSGISKHSYAQSETRIEIGLSSGEAVHFVVTDPKERRAGKDPRKDMEYPLDEIPDMVYDGQVSVGSTDPDADPRASRAFMARNSDATQPSGTYEIKVVGVRTDPYGIGGLARIGSGFEMKQYTFEKESVIMEDSVHHYRMHLPSDTTEEAWLRRVIEPASLRRDLEAMNEVAHLTLPGEYSVASTRVGDYRAALAQGDSVAARQELEALAEYFEQNKDGTYVNTYDMLMQDVERLLAKLPEGNGGGEDDDTAYGANQLGDSGRFEAASLSAAGWSTWGPCGPTGAADRIESTGTAAEGTRYGAHRPSSEGGEAVYTHHTLTGLKPGALYEVSARVRRTGDSDWQYTPRLEVKYDPQAEEPALAAEAPASSDEWREVTISGVEVPESGTVVIGFYSKIAADASGEKARFDFDAVRLERID